MSGKLSNFYFSGNLTSLVKLTLALLRTARYTEYSNISPCAALGGSQDKCAPSVDLAILMADGAPGKPGRHVLKAETYKENT